MIPDFDDLGGGDDTGLVDPAQDDMAAMVEEGREAFRYDTFGDEVFWGDTLRLHEAIAGDANGGTGPGVSPNLALAVGLKVDSTAVPQEIVDGILDGSISLDDPATTIALLELNAVVGLTGFFDGAGTLTSVGIQCALCHSTVDDSFLPGIGQRLDGWANRDLDVGAIVALAPDLTAFTDLLGVDDATLRSILLMWGPGRYDAELKLDGKALGPDGQPLTTLIPPAFGLQGVNLHTWTGWGSIPYWNAFVAIVQMGGIGNFFDPRLDDADRFPIAAANGFGHIVVDPDEDRVSPKLGPLQAYQLSLLAPEPPAGSFDPDAAERGDELFEGKAGCISCHVDPQYTEPGWQMHKAEEICIDSIQANRAPQRGYRTAPLRGLWTHQEPGFYHDGRFDTLDGVVEHYDACFGLGLTEDEQDDLVQYLLSL
jgi:hypothetical protein